MPDIMIRLIILDFDGVILESVEVKTEVFRSLFSFSPNEVDEIVSFHRQNGGMSRFDKFDYIYKNILKKPLTSQRKEELSDQFSTLVFEKILAAPFVLGAYEFLRKFHSSIPLYVVSATPEHELIQIISRRGLPSFFHGIYGSPQKKSDCIREIIEQSGIPPSAIVFVGDAENDYEAARSAGIRFIGRVKPGDKNRFEGLTGVETVIPDLYELARYIEVNY
jgi:HAD superfamily hydrolase (TIGR01549 family)